MSAGTGAVGFQYVRRAPSKAIKLRGTTGRVRAGGDRDLAPEWLPVDSCYRWQRPSIDCVSERAEGLPQVAS